MINVIVKLTDNNYEYLKIEGHANFDKNGRDLVCAAVSSIATGGLNNLIEIESYRVVNFTEGLIEISFDGNISYHDNIVIETVITQLKTIENVYNKHIKITEKGKY